MFTQQCCVNELFVCGDLFEGEVKVVVTFINFKEFEAKISDAIFWKIIIEV